jgi:hypothetical protein
MLLFSAIVAIWGIATMYVYKKVRFPPENQELQYDPLYELDTVVTRYWEFEGFQFYLKHIHGVTMIEKKAFTSVHLTASDQSYFLFDAHEFINEMGAEPVWLFDDIYSYPYYTGGNYSRSRGIEIFRVNEDTAIYLGPVVGYDDIDEDGQKEFWLFVISEFGEGAAFNKYEKLEVFLEGDSLIYPYLDGAY